MTRRLFSTLFAAVVRGSRLRPSPTVVDSRTVPVLLPPGAADSLGHPAAALCARLHLDSGGRITPDDRLVISLDRQSFAVAISGLLRNGYGGEGRRSAPPAPRALPRIRQAGQRLSREPRWGLMRSAYRDLAARVLGVFPPAVASRARWTSWRTCASSSTCSIRRSAGNRGRRRGRIDVVGHRQRRSSR